VDDHAVQRREAQRERAQRTPDELSRRQRNVLRQAQNREPGDPFEQGLRENYNELEAERAATLAEIRELNAADDTELDTPTMDDADLLHALPYLALNPADAPKDLIRRLIPLSGTLPLSVLCRAWYGWTLGNQGTTGGGGIGVDRVRLRRLRFG